MFVRLRVPPRHRKSYPTSGWEKSPSVGPKIPKLVPILGKLRYFWINVARIRAGTPNGEGRGTAGVWLLALLRFLYYLTAMLPAMQRKHPGHNQSNVSEFSAQKNLPLPLNHAGNPAINTDLVCADWQWVSREIIWIIFRFEKTRIRLNILTKNIQNTSYLLRILGVMTRKRLTNFYILKFWTLKDIFERSWTLFLMQQEHIFSICITRSHAHCDIYFHCANVQISHCLL